MNLSRRALLGGGASLVARGVGFVAQFAALALVRQRYSLEELGLFSVLVSFLALYDLLNFGLVSAGMRYKLATLFSRGESGEELFFATFTLSALIYLVLALLLPIFSLGKFFLVALLLIALRAPFLLMRQALCAQQRIHLRALLEGSEYLLATGVLFFARGSFFVLVMSYFGALFLASLLFFFLFLQAQGWRLRWVSFEKIRFHLGPLLRFSLLSWGQNLLLLLIIGTQPLLMSLCLSLEETGRVALLYKCFGMLFGVHYAILNPFLSLTTAADASGRRAWLEKMVRRFRRWFLPIFCLAITALYFGSQRLLCSPPLFFALSVFALSYMWGSLFATFLDGLARVKRQFFFLIVATFLHFLCTPYLARLWGAPGFFLGEALALLPLALSNQREVKTCVC